MTAATWSPDGRLLLTGGADLAILVWDAVSGHLLSRETMPFDRSRVPHDNMSQSFAISRIIISPDGTRFASTIDFDYGEQHETVVWDTATRQILRDMPGAALSWSADSRRLLMLGSSIRRQDDSRPPVSLSWLSIEGDTQSPPLLMLAHPSMVSRSPDRRWLLLGCGVQDRCALHVLDAEGHAAAGPIPDIQQLIDIAWTADGTAWLLDGKRVIHVYKPGRAEQRFTLPPLLPNNVGGWSLSISPDATRFAFEEIAPYDPEHPRAEQSVLRLADSQTGAALGLARAPFPSLGEKLSLSGSTVVAVAGNGLAVPSPDRRRIARTKARGMEITSVDGKDAPVTLAPGLPIKVLDAAVSADGQLVALLEGLWGDGRSTELDMPSRTRVETWDAEQGRFLPDIALDDSYEHVRWIDGDRLAVMGLGKTPTAIVDVRSGGVIETMPVRDVHPIGQNRYFASTGETHGSFTTISTGFALYDASKKQFVSQFGEPKDGGGMRDYAVSPDGGMIAQLGLGHGTGGARWGKILLWNTGTGALTATLGDRTDVGEALAFSADGRQLLAAQGNKLVAWDMETNAELRTLSIHPNTILHVAVSPKGLVATAAASESGIGLTMLDGRTLPTLDIPAVQVAALGFVENKPILWAAASNGMVRFWSTTDRGEIFTLHTFPDRRFIAVAPDGRYETNLPAETSAIGWVMLDAPFTLLAPQTFMRDYFEPRLAARLIGCGLPIKDCDGFKPLPPLQSLNRLRPQTTINHVSITDSGKAEVTVTVNEVSDAGAVNGRVHSGAFDVRLFRDGHLVAEWPNPTLSHPPGNWQQRSGIIKPGSGQSFTQTVGVPVQTDAGKVEFSAYAFNDDRVKGDTAQALLPLKAGPRRLRRAFVIAIGIDAYREKTWRLRFAASDAQALATALGTISDYQIVPVTLLADADHAQADKADIQALLALLAGHEAGRARLAAKGIDLSGVSKATPDDAVFISFSGHGDADANRNFFLVPADGRRSGDGLPDPRSLISSDELTDWLRDVDAGELALVIDACHSAASVDTGDFKPAPIGDPGLGQLAFDKGIRILAASQGDGVAMESATLRHGLLTYALIEDGLAKGFADLDHDGRITLDELLRYAELRLPELSRPKAAGPTALAARTLIFDGETAPRRNVQKPQLFDFTDRASPLVVRAATAQTK